MIARAVARMDVDDAEGALALRDALEISLADFPLVSVEVALEEQAFDVAGVDVSTGEPFVEQVVAPDEDAARDRAATGDRVAATVAPSPIGGDVGSPIDPLQDFPQEEHDDARE